MISERKNIIYEITWLKYLVANYLDSEALHFICQEEGRYTRLMQQLTDFSKKFIQIKCKRECMSEHEALTVYTIGLNLLSVTEIYNPHIFFDYYFYLDESTAENPFSKAYQQKKEQTKRIIELYLLMVYTVLNVEDEEEFDANHPKNTYDIEIFNVYST